MLTLVTESFGVRGRAGDLEIAPALMREQFDASGTARIELPFAGKRFCITIRNPKKLEYGEYGIRSAAVDGRPLSLAEAGGPAGSGEPNGQSAAGAVLTRAEMEQLTGEVHNIDILLGAAEGGLR